MSRQNKDSPFAKSLDLLADISLTELLSLAQWYSRTVWILEKPWTSAERWNARSKLCVLNGNGPLQCPAHLKCKLLFEQRCTFWRHLSLKQLVRLFSAPDITLRFNQGLPQVPRPSLETSQAWSFFVNCDLWCFEGPYWFEGTTATADFKVNQAVMKVVSRFDPSAGNLSNLVMGSGEMGEEGGSRELNFYDTIARYCKGELAKCLFLKACCI